MLCHIARPRPFAFRGLASLLSVTALALLATGNSFAQQTPTGETRTIERRSMPAQAEQDINKYQTREGRLQAKPLDWNTTTGTPSPSAAQPAAPTDTNVPGGTSAEGAPNPRAKTDAQRMYPNDWPRQQGPSRPGRRGMLDPNPITGNIQLAAGSPDIFTQYGEYAPAVNPDAPISVGKLFSNAGTCTASVVSPNNAIVTAAHCCWDRSKNNWIGGWAFSPAYNNGNAPYGTFNWSSATILTGWVNNGDIPSDVCVIRLQNDRAGRGVTYYTGWLGRSWDWGSDQEHHALGYPGNIGNANLLEACTSESFSPSASCGGSGVLNMGCSMTFGSSGGPWVRNYRSDNWVNAVVHGYDSTTCTGTFGKTFNGPRFTSGNIVTVCNAAGC